MKIEETSIEGLCIFTPRIFSDERGSFHESFRKSFFDEIFDNINFIQENESISKRGVLRGLHFQVPPFSQSKLIKVNHGKIFDVAVDLRLNSKTFGCHYSIVLDDISKQQFFIPKGFAHGFLVLSDKAHVSYKVDQYYNKDAECGIIFNDQDFLIDWPISKEQIILSEKDKSNISFDDFKNRFIFE